MQSTNVFLPDASTGLPVAQKSTAAGAAHVAVQSLAAGELSQFNTTAAMAVWIAIDAGTTAVAISGGPWIFGGVRCKTGGTLTSIHDNSAASGAMLIGNTGVKAAGDVVLPYGGGGVITNSTSMFPTFASGTWDILVRTPV